MPVFRQRVPPHLELTPTSNIFVKQNDLLQFALYQHTGVAVSGLAYPFAFLIGLKKQLAIEV
jgi:hypothetical protein